MGAREPDLGTERIMSLREKTRRRMVPLLQ